jgi:hypothetical protein
MFAYIPAHAVHGGNGLYNILPPWQIIVLNRVTKPYLPALKMKQVIVNAVIQPHALRTYKHRRDNINGRSGALIQNAAMLISNCTGVSHIASAFKTPSIVISMDGEPQRWGPLDNACAPYY